jgi:hypothetical protein
VPLTSVDVIEVNGITLIGHQISLGLAEMAGINQGGAFGNENV